MACGMDLGLRSLHFGVTASQVSRQYDVDGVEQLGGSGECSGLWCEPAGLGLAVRAGAVVE